MRKLRLGSGLIAALSVLAACGGNDSLPTYRCVKTIDGANESGGPIAALGNIAYVGGFGTVGVFDLSNPSAPATLAPIPFPQHVEAIAASGNRLVVAGSQLFQVFDASDPKAPVKLGQLATVGIAANAMLTDGRYVYAGSPTGTISVFDISAATPALVTVTSDGTLEVSSIALNGTTLYEAGGQSGSLGVFDFSDHKLLKPQPRVQVMSSLEALVLDGGALFALGLQATGTSANPRAQRIDLGNPLAPTLTASSGEVCGCEATTESFQATAAHGHFIAPGVKALYGWSEGNVAGGSVQVGPVCLPEQLNVQHALAVGSAIVMTGGSAIGFLAP
jgi:hypothetical protein